MELDPSQRSRYWEMGQALGKKNQMTFRKKFGIREAHKMLRGKFS